ALLGGERRPQHPVEHRVAGPQGERRLEGRHGFGGPLLLEEEATQLVARIGVVRRELAEPLEARLRLVEEPRLARRRAQVVQGRLEVRRACKTLAIALHRGSEVSGGPVGVPQRLAGLDIGRVGRERPLQLRELFAHTALTALTLRAGPAAPAGRSPTWRSPRARRRSPG